MTKAVLSLVIITGVRLTRDEQRDVRNLGRLVRGERDALGELYDAHAASLFRHGLSLTRSHAEAEDLVQAVFVKLATTGAALLSVRSPANYMHRMLHTAWIDGQRRPATTRESAVDANDLRPVAGAAIDQDSVIDVARALAELPAAQREIVHLHLNEGLSFREAGRMTGVSMFTAASRYRAALQRLRQLMGKR
ncbi:MAG: RNA polymerase sigma factor [Acidobacteria bacterium]|nr:RNA polymerase sigma factor [Acidobacteriota bacterium]